MDAKAHHIASQLPCKMLRGKWRSLEAVSCGSKSKLISIQVKMVIVSLPKTKTMVEKVFSFQKFPVFFYQIEIQFRQPNNYKMSLI